MERLIPYRTYWIAWGILLGLTTVMIVTEGAGLPEAAGIAVILGAMVTKVTMIGGWYMHLKFERAALWVAVAGATLATAVVLFALIAPDGVSMLRHAAQ